MQLVEKHIIKKIDERFKEIDKSAFASKNLYNAANYIIRQEFFTTGHYLNYNNLDKKLQNTEQYKELPAKVSQQILINLDNNWKSFFASIEEYKINPEKFKGKPKPPKYKDKQKGRNSLIYTIQAISKKELKKGYIKPSKLDILIKTKQNKVDCVRITPKKTCYVVEVVYSIEPQITSVDINLIAGIDIGLDNLATVTSNKPGFIPVVVNGRPLKSINQFYNKIKSELQSYIGDKKNSNRIYKLTDKRNKKIEHELHVASRFVINLLLEEKIGHLIIGKNINWKQKINIGVKNNQNFVFIPHSHFINMLTYKAELVGIKVTLTEESYTSKASFLDNDNIPVYNKNSVNIYKFSGRRIKRGLYKSKSGKLINADCNGSYNVIKKVAPNAFSNGVEDVVVHPLRWGLKIK